MTESQTGTTGDGDTPCMLFVLIQQEQDKTRQDKTRQDKTRQGKGREGKGREDRTGQDKAGQHNTRAVRIMKSRNKEPIRKKK